MISVPPDAAEKPFVLAIDIGSSSVRASLHDSRGRPIGDLVARQSWQLPIGADGSAQADADDILQMVITVIDEEAAKCGTYAQHIAGVGMSTLAGNIVGVDADGNAVTPLTTYADTRASAETKALRGLFDETAVHNRTGCRFHPAYLPARFLWMANEHPEWLKAAERWVTIGEYVQLQLLGQANGSYSMASWNGLLDLRKAQYDVDLLAALPVSETALLPLADASAGARGLKSNFADRWPALHDVPWFPPIGDGAAANIGSACTTDQRLAITIGTSSAVRIILKDVPQQIPTGLWCYRIDSAHVLLGGALSEGGSVYAWMQSTLDMAQIDDIDAALAEIAPDSHGLTVLPLFRGERSPGYQADMRGSILGLSVTTKPIHLMRAGLEGVGYRIGQLVKLIAPSLAPDATIIASGGAAMTSVVWGQILADVIGRPLAVSQVAEASSRGVALATLRAISAISDWDSAPDFTERTYQPDSDAHKVYQDAAERQQALYNWQRDYHPRS